MSEIHVHSDLLGATLEDRHLLRRRVMAVWLDQQTNPPTLMALTVEVDNGIFFKMVLPDRDWTLAETEPRISRKSI